MKVTDIGLFDESFTHIHEEDPSKQTTYAVTALLAYCEAHAPTDITPPPDDLVLNDLDLGGLIHKIHVPVEEHHAQYCLEHRGVEPHRLKRIITGGLPVLRRPLCFIQMPDATMLLVDGTHRYVLAFALKMSVLEAYVVPWAVAQNYVIEDAPFCDPATLLSGWSGL